MRNPLLWAVVAATLVGCASTGGSGAAREIEPGEIPHALGDSLIAIELENQNFEEALVLIELPEGQTVRLGWIPGERSRAWLVPMEVSGFVRFRIQLTAAQNRAPGGRNERTVVRCTSRMFFSPGVARTLMIYEPVGRGNFCPGARA